MKKLHLLVLLIIAYTALPLSAQDLHLTGCKYGFTSSWSSMYVSFISKDTCVIDYAVVCSFPEKYRHTKDTFLYKLIPNTTKWCQSIQKEYGYLIKFHNLSHDCPKTIGIEVPEIYKSGSKYVGAIEIRRDGQDINDYVSHSYFYYPKFTARIHRASEQFRCYRFGDDFELQMSYTPSALTNGMLYHYLTIKNGIPSIKCRQIGIGPKKAKREMDKQIQAQTEYLFHYMNDMHPYSYAELIGHSFTYKDTISEEFLFADSTHCIYRQYWDSIMLYQVNCTYELLKDFVVLHKQSAYPEWMDSGESNMQFVAQDSIHQLYPQLPQFFTTNNIRTDTLRYRSGVLVYNKIYNENRRLLPQYPCPGAKPAIMYIKSYIAENRLDITDKEIIDLFNDLYIPINFYYTPQPEEELLRSIYFKRKAPDDPPQRFDQPYIR